MSTCDGDFGRFVSFAFSFFPFTLFSSFLSLSFYPFSLSLPSFAPTILIEIFQPGTRSRADTSFSIEFFSFFFCFPRNSIFQLSPENSSILRSILIYLLQFSIKRYPRERIEIPGWILSFRSYIFGISINIIETEWCLSRFRKKKNKERKIIYRGEKNKDAKVVLTVLQPDRNSQSKRESRR